MQVREGFKKVPLHLVGRNPLNPRTVFEGESFNELVESVRKKGVLQPVLVRPVAEGSRMETDSKSPTHGLEVEYELVFGERRFRAMCQVASENGGLQEHSIPAMVRNLSDEDAFDAMVLENLEREDLSPLEEARSFQAYIERRGEHGAMELAERIGIHPRYIRRRVAVLSLPESVLERWNAGELLYGHLEQLLRVQEDPERLEELAEECGDYGHTVADLRREIDGDSPPLAWALFDLGAEGCMRCHKNSEVQKDLFGETASTDKALCLDSKCFRQKQNNWLNGHWHMTDTAEQLGTNGFRFRDRLDYNEYEIFHDKAPEACASCEHFVSLVQLDGKVQYDSYGLACVGDKKCYRSQMARATAGNESGTKSASAPAAGSDDEGTAEPRVYWHGSHFRQKFYDQQFEMRFELVETGSEPMLRVALLAILHGRPHLRTWFVERHPDVALEGIQTYDDRPVMNESKAFDKIMGMVAESLETEIQVASVQLLLLETGAANREREFLAKHLGARLEQHYAMDEEYLQKKTRAELLELGEQLGVFDTPEARAYRVEILGKKIGGKMDQLKKGELVDVFLKSGADLVGRVPAEILAADKEAREIERFEEE